MTDPAWAEQHREAITRAVNRMLAQGYTREEIHIERPDPDRVIGPFRVPYLVKATRESSQPR